jgi:hypothetical protein
MTDSETIEMTRYHREIVENLRPMLKTETLSLRKGPNPWHSVLVDGDSASGVELVEKHTKIYPVDAAPATGEAQG